MNTKLQMQCNTKSFTQKFGDHGACKVGAKSWVKLGGLGRWGGWKVGRLRLDEAFRQLLLCSLDEERGELTKML